MFDSVSGGIPPRKRSGPEKDRLEAAEARGRRREDAPGPRLENRSQTLGTLIRVEMRSGFWEKT